MLNIYCNSKFKVEREYILHVIFNYFWGIEYEINYCDISNVRLEIEDKYIEVADIFFNMDEDIYLTKESLPVQPLDICNFKSTEFEKMLVEGNIPVIYGKKISNGQYFSEDDTGVELGIDIFGSAFFMLTCYEETVKTERDVHDRFLAKDSLAYQEGFLLRPIINEYLEILWKSLNKFYPNLKRKQREFKIMPTHDVDRIIGKANLSMYQRVHEIAGDILKRHDLGCFFNNLKLLRKIPCGDYESELQYTFDYIMDLSESIETKSTFFFMTAQGLSGIDGNYDISSDQSVSLIKRILARGHNIGIHPSYVSYQDKHVISNNVDKLRKTLDDNNINIESFGGRQHYLRWDAKCTWQYYEESSIEFDTTLSFADHVGFRTGICYEYPVYNIRARKMLKLIEYPLIIMDCSFWGYMHIDYMKMIEYGCEMKSLCKKYYGNFVILWHNDQFLNRKKREIYYKIIKS